MIAPTQRASRASSRIIQKPTSRSITGVLMAYMMPGPANRCTAFRSLIARAIRSPVRVCWKKPRWRRCRWAEESLRISYSMRGGGGGACAVRPQEEGEGRAPQRQGDVGGGQAQERLRGDAPADAVHGPPQDRRRDQGDTGGDDAEGEPFPVLPAVPEDVRTEALTDHRD